MNIQRKFLVENLIDYIKKNFNNGLCIKTLSKYFNISRTYLNVIFRERTGLSIREYTNKCRIEKLRELIKKGDNAKGYAIGKEVGFKNEFQFYRWVKKNFGITFNELKEKLSPPPPHTHNFQIQVKENNQKDLSLNVNIANFV